MNLAAYTDEELMQIAGQEPPPSGGLSDYSDGELIAIAGESAPAPKTTAMPEEPGFLGNVWQDIKKRGANIAEIMTKSIDPYRTGDVGLRQEISNVPSRLLQAVGQVAAGATNIAGEGIKSAYQTLVPEDIRQTAGQIVKESPLPGILEAGARIVGPAYRQLEETFPEGMKNVEAVAHIVGAAPVVAGIKALGPGARAVGREGLAIAKDIGTLARNPAAIDAAIDAAIEKGFRKGIKPTIVGKSDAGLTEKYYNNAKQAVREIVDENPEFIEAIKKSAAPIEEFSTVIRSKKKAIYEKSAFLAKEAGQQGAMTPLTTAKVELQQIIDAPYVLASEKRMAAKWLDELAPYGDKAPPPAIDELLAKLNARSEAFWNNPNPNDLSDAVMAERIAHRVLGAQEATIESYVGPGHQEFRRLYGSLSAIEKSVTDRANVSARQAVKGFFDLTDVGTAGEFVRGLAALGRGELTGLSAAVARYGMKKHIKDVNNVNNIIRDMFTEVDRLQTLKGGGALESRTGTVLGEWWRGTNRPPTPEMLAEMQEAPFDYQLPPAGYRPTAQPRPYLDTGSQLTRTDDWQLPLPREGRFFPPYGPEIDVNAVMRRPSLEPPPQPISPREALHSGGIGAPSRLTSPSRIVTRGTIQTPGELTGQPVVKPFQRSLRQSRNALKKQ